MGCVLGALVVVVIIPTLCLYPSKRAADTEMASADGDGTMISSTMPRSDAVDAVDVKESATKVSDEPPAAQYDEQPAEGPTRHPQPSLLQYARLLPVDIWVVATMASLYTSKWAW